MTETFDELVERWGEAMAGRAEPLTPLERALVNHGVEDAYLEYAALRAELAAAGLENQRLREAARDVLQQHNQEEDGTTWLFHEGHPCNGIPVYYIGDEADRDLAIHQLAAALEVEQ